MATNYTHRLASKAVDDKGVTEKMLRGARVDTQQLGDLIKTYVLAHPYFSFDVSDVTTRPQDKLCAAQKHTSDSVQGKGGANAGKDIMTIKLEMPQVHPAWNRAELPGKDDVEQGQKTARESVEDRSVEDLAFKNVMAWRVSAVRGKPRNTEERKGVGWETRSKDGEGTEAIDLERARNCNTPLIGTEKGLWQVDEEVASPYSTVVKETEYFRGKVFAKTDGNGLQARHIWWEAQNCNHSQRQ